MISHWIKPIDNTSFTDQNVSQDQIGYRLGKINNDSSFDDFSVLVLFANMPLNYHFRKSLNKLSDHFSIKFADIGHPRSEGLNSIVPLLKDLSSNHKIFIIGGNQDEIDIILRTIRTNTSRQITTIISPNGQKVDSEITNHLGWQRHYTNKSIIENEISTNDLALGKLKSNINLAEPLIRESHHVVMDILSLDNSCFPSANKTGLNIYEAAQTMKLIGLSEKVRTVQVKIENQNAEQVSEVCALLFWYYLEGVEYQSNESVHSKNNKTYIVNLDQYDQDLTFIKGEKTGKWWIKNPGTTNKKEYIPCTHEDYEAVCKSEIPENILSLFE